jgi:selenocysteine lyase/cysteine desulfurase
MNRRKFLDALAITAAGFAALPASHEPSLSRYQTGKIRSEARSLREEFSFPEGYVYLNTGGIGSVPRFVRELVSEEWNRLEQAPSPGHDMVFWSDLKRETAAFLGTGVSPSEIAFTGCATEGINIILNGIEFKKGDEIVTSTHEHPALNIPLLNLSVRKGIKIKTFEPDIHSGLNNVNRVTDLIGKNTKLVFVSNRTATTGQIFPVKEIGAALAGRNILFAIDGAQVPGSMPVDLSDLNADFYTFSCHKWMLAPRRTGVLWVKENNFDILNPSVTGAYSDSSHSLRERRIELHTTAQRYEYGTQNDLLFKGMQASMRFLTAAGIKSVRENNEVLSED